MTRYLDDDLWQEVKLTIDQMPKDTRREREHYFRARWLFSLLYVCELRIAEVGRSQMGKFFCRCDQNGKERWWLEVLDKNDKVRIVPATDELMTELALYRRALGMPPLPIPNEATPLVLPILGKHKSMTRGAVHLLVKEIFHITADRIAQRGPEHQDKAARLLHASANWLRPTSRSYMPHSAVDLGNVRDNTGHESPTPINGYLDCSDDERHRETEEKHKICW